MHTPINRVPELDERRLEAMVEQWITSAEQLIGMAQTPTLNDRLAGRLGMSPEELEYIANSAKSIAPTPWAEGPPPPLESFGLGLAMDAQQAMRMSCRNPYDKSILQGTFTAENLPAMVNLVDKMGPVRDQGERGTCVSFASLAAREFLAGNAVDLSEQHFYWNCKQHDNMPEESGTTLQTAAMVFREYGVCEESMWPYDPTQGDREDGGDPPSGWEAAAEEYAWDNAGGVDASIEAIKRILAGEAVDTPQPVVIGAIVFESSFFSPDTLYSGRITMPFHGEPHAGGHAMCVVGYQDDNKAPGGGYWILRNSWGSRWGAACEHGGGYGLMPYAYFRLYGVDAFALDGRLSPDASQLFAPLSEKTSFDVEMDTVWKPVSEYDTDSGPWRCSGCGEVYNSQLSVAGRCPETRKPICLTCKQVRGITSLADVEEDDEAGIEQL